VSWILYQVRVSRELGRGERIQITERLGRCTGWRATLPLPQVVTAREQPKPNEVGPAMGLPQQLPSPLVEDELQRELGVGDIGAGVAVGPVPQEVDIRQRLRSIATGPEQRLGSDQVHVAKAKERKVGVDVGQVGASGAEAGDVLILRRRDAIGEVA